MSVLNLQNPWVRRLISLSFIVIVAIVAHFLAILTWKLIVTPNHSYSSVIKLPKQEVRTNSGIPDSTKASRIANVHVFGQFREQVEVVEEVAKPEPVTRITPLKFILKATALGSDPKNGLATIADGKIVKMFRVGEDVFEKATLYAVYSEHVEFERDNGDIEILELPSDKKKSLDAYIPPERGANLGSEFDYKVDTSTSNKTYSRTQPKSTTSQNNTSSTNKNNLPEIVTNVPRAAKVNEVQDSIDKDSKVKSSVKRYVTNQVNKAKSNPTSTLTQYGLKYIEGKGYEVTSRARDLMLLGLRAGDIIISINGHSATSPEEDIKLIDEVMASGEILIEYERNGKVLVMKQALLQF